MYQRKKPKEARNILDDVLTVAEYIEYRVQGFSDKEVAKHILFVGLHTLQRWKAKVGVKRFHVNVRRYEIIKELDQKGYSNYKMAVFFKLTPRHVQKIRQTFAQLENAPQEVELKKAS